ncbi:MAG: tetratricopeptide repeat protein [Elusimicrobia bacterium]|nr:tetratricopeptide repeat protein [Elusimicrobiota bacterium]
MEIKNRTAVFFALTIALAAGAGRCMAAPADAAADRPEKAQAAAPAAPGAAALPGRAEIKIEKLDLAAAVKEIASGDADGMADLYQKIADIYMRAQKQDKAISLLETYRGQGGTNQTILASLAGFYMQRGALKQAAEVYETMAKLPAGADRMATSALLNIYRQQGDFKKGAALVEATAKANPSNPEVFLQASDYYLQNDDTVKAEEAMRKVIALTPKAEYYKQLAQITLRQGSLDKAVAALQEGIKKTPGSEVELTVMTADLYAQTGQADKALSILDEAVKKLPAGQLELTFAVSNIYLRKGEQDKAAEVLKALLEKVSDPARKEVVQQRLNNLRSAQSPASAVAPVPAMAAAMAGMAPSPAPAIVPAAMPQAAPGAVPAGAQPPVNP